MSGLIVVAVFLVTFFGIAYGYFTREGSGIETRPWDGQGRDGEAAPGAKGAEEVDGRDHGEGSAFDTHGTK